MHKTVVYIMKLRETPLLNTLINPTLSLGVSFKMFLFTNNILKDPAYTVKTE